MRREEEKTADGDGETDRLENKPHLRIIQNFSGIKIIEWSHIVVPNLTQMMRGGEVDNGHEQEGETESAAVIFVFHDRVVGTRAYTLNGRWFE